MVDFQAAVVLAATRRRPRVRWNALWFGFATHSFSRGSSFRGPLASRGFNSRGLNRSRNFNNRSRDRFRIRSYGYGNNCYGGYGCGYGSGYGYPYLGGGIDPTGGGIPVPPTIKTSKIKLALPMR